MPETIIESTNIDTQTEPEGKQSMTASFMLDPTGKPSESGKNIVVASTGGFIQVGEYKVSINVIKKRK